MKTLRLLAIALVATPFCKPQAQAALQCSITSQSQSNAAVISWLSQTGETYALRRSDELNGSWRVVSLQTASAEPLSVRLPVEGRAVFFQLIEAPPNPDPEHLVWIPPGTFTMGSPTNEVGRTEWEGPQTEVTISRGYWMGKFEVTQEEYEAVMGVNPSSWKGPSKPVNMVSWGDAGTYCAALTEQERAAGRLPSNCVYRLPTEAEWEYACRAGTTTRFSYGDDPGYTTLAAYAWYGDDSILYPQGAHPVGEKLPNPWGLYDMPGNVWEWCHDWLAYYAGGTAVDPQEAGGPRIMDLGRVLRGGVWFSYARLCRSAARVGSDPGGRWADYGFRVVLAPSLP